MCTYLEELRCDTRYNFICYFIPKGYQRRFLCTYIEEHEPKLLAISLCCKTPPQTSTIRLPTEKARCMKCGGALRVKQVRQERCYSCYNCETNYELDSEFQKYEYKIPDGNVILVARKKHLKGWAQRATVNKDTATWETIDDILRKRQRFEVNIPEIIPHGKKKLADYVDEYYVPEENSW